MSVLAFALALSAACFAWLGRRLAALPRRFGAHDSARGYGRAAQASRRFPHAPAKPAWARQEIIRLKALMPYAGCGAVSDIFNRRFAAKRRVTVGKTFVAELIRQQRYAIEI